MAAEGTEGLGDNGAVGNTESRPPPESTGPKPMLTAADAHGTRPGPWKNRQRQPVRKPQYPKRKAKEGEYVIEEKTTRSGGSPPGTVWCHASRSQDGVRRAGDILISLLCLLVLWPVMLVTVILLLVENPGASPVFMQTRVGRNGREFTLFKFRSMVPGAEDRLEELLPQNEMDGPAFKMHNDPRITPLGRFLRRSSIDELPQLFNVLRGDMSLVGPRPALPREVALYDQRARGRLAVKPGMTCYWQIRPDRNSLRFEQWLELDLKYIREQSIPVDLLILLKTIGAVAGMDGI